MLASRITITIAANKNPKPYRPINMGRVAASAANTLPVISKPKSRAPKISMITAVIAVTIRLVIVWPISSTERGIGASQLLSNTPASISFFSA